MKINYKELQIAITTSDRVGWGQYYLDTATDKVLLVSEWVEGKARKFDDLAAVRDETSRLACYCLWHDGKVGAELLEAEKCSMTQQADAYLKRFLTVSQADSHDAYQDRVDFADTVANPHLRELLQAD